MTFPHYFITWYLSMRVKLINVKKKNRVISYSAGTLNELVSRNLTGFKLFEQGGGRWGI